MKARKKSRKQPKREQVPGDLVDRWQNTPAVNPFYRGKTPAEVARALLKPKKR